MNLVHKADRYELELVSACVNHDRQAQRTVYDKYKDRMYTILYRMLNDEDDAADALQDAFIQIFKSIGSFQGRSTLGAWIKVIVVRAGLAKQKKVIPIESLEDQTALSEQVTIEWDENLTGEYLEKGIAQLSQGYRNVFLLIEVEGYSHKEVAELLGISIGTSKSQLYNAKQKLQKILKEIMY
ncbi:RNA polymerase sigma factor [Fulvivirgaceae bacterium BMA10]|uniref:RNA polymerase sigma factor n=1 Tax=Splendidivirga corallicola TaxID=3051826 RepID=A0ABT8KL70_9BACT|nr:RNA polymerase sigma factor [Fulvivirgaceae bacterium BMA10]